MTDHQEQNAPTQERVEALSRRGMLRYGAAAAAAAAATGAAGSAALGAPAQAAAGDALKIDGDNAGTKATKLAGSGLEVSAAATSSVSGVEAAAVTGIATGVNGAGVVGVGSGTHGAGVVAINPSGPQLLLGTSTREQYPQFPPTTGRYEVGAIVNWEWTLFQCVESNGAADSKTTWVPYGGEPTLTLLPQPVRVYSSYEDTAHQAAKIGRNETRTVDTLTTLDNVASGVPPWATAVVGSVQISATETNLGYLSIASGDVAAPAGYSTIVWSAVNLSNATAFTSALGTGDEKYGLLSVASHGSAAGAKTHFMIDIVGYYAPSFYRGGPGTAATALQPNLQRRAAALRRPAARAKK